MPTSSAEINDLVSEVEAPFIASGSKGRSVRDRMRTLDDIIFTRYDYASELSPLLAQRIDSPADTLRSFKEQAKAALLDDIRLSLEPVGGLKRQESAADRVELMEAYTLMRLNPDDYVRSVCHHMQAVGFFFAGWLEMRSPMIPERAKGESAAGHNKRVETYKAGWFPWTLTPRDSQTVAFMEHSRQVTTAVLRFRLPYIDLVERYSGDYNARRDDPERCLEIFGEHFGWLRAGEPSSDFGVRDLMRREAEVCLVDDGVNISHYIDQLAMGERLYHHEDKDQYRGVGETDYPNPFRQPSLLLAEGVYNPFQELAYRREPLLMALAQIEHGKARIKSHIISRASSPPPIYEELPESVALWFAQNRDQAPAELTARLVVDANGMPHAIRSFGALKEMETAVEAPIKEMFEILQQEESVASPRGLLFDDEKLSDVVGSLALAQIDERNLLVAEAKKSECNMWSRVLDMIRVSQKDILNAHRKTGEPKQYADWPMAGIATGKEWPIKGRVIERGEKFEITPQDYDTEYVRSLDPVDNRASTMAVRRAAANERRENGTILWSEYLEENGVTNQSEFNKKMTEQQLYQLEGPRQVMETRLKVAQFTAAFNGQTVEDVLAGMPEAMVPQIVQAAAPDLGPAGAGPYQMSSPQLDPAVGAGATAGVV